MKPARRHNFFDLAYEIFCVLTAAAFAARRCARKNLYCLRQIFMTSVVK